MYNDPKIALTYMYKMYNNILIINILAFLSWYSCQYNRYYKLPICIILQQIIKLETIHKNDVSLPYRRQPNQYSVWTRNPNPGVQLGEGKIK